MDSRTQIWTTLLQVANINGIDPAELCAYDINGCALSSIFGLLYPNGHYLLCLLFLLVNYLF